MPHVYRVLRLERNLKLTMFDCGLCTASSSRKARANACFRHGAKLRRYRAYRIRENGRGRNRP
jgi:hypothetical protein